MDTPQLPIDDNFFKQFKNAEELDNFLHSIFKRGVESMLQSELSEHPCLPAGRLSRLKL